jgi:hypothetical protein
MSIQFGLKIRCDIDVSYGDVQGLVIAASVRVCSAIAPRGVCGRGKVLHRKIRYDLHILLPKHVDRSLLWHLKSRSRTLDGGLAMEVIHQLG